MSEDPQTKNPAPDERPQDSPESKLLLSRFARGDDSALGRLVDREGNWLLRRIRGKIPRGLERRVGASDILQLTAMDLMSVRDRFENLGMHAFRRLMVTISDRVLADEVKRESAQRRDWARQASLTSPSQSHESQHPLQRIAADQTSPSQIYVRQENKQLIESCFLLLAPLDRTVIRLIDFDQVGYEKASEILGTSQQTTRQRYCRAVARLRHHVTRLDPGSVHRP